MGIFAMGTCIQSSLALKFGIGVGSLCEMIMIGLVCCELFLMVSDRSPVVAENLTMVMFPY